MVCLLVFISGLATGLLCAQYAVIEGLLIHLRAWLWRETRETFSTDDVLLNYPLSAPSSWGNLGYWSGTSGSDFVKANQALAIRMGRFADLKSNDAVCDIGFGCGDQIQVWFEDFQIQSVFGLNVSQSQCLKASQLLSQYIDSGQLEIRHDAHTYLAGSREKWSKILALDCAYHFSERSQFLEVVRERLLPGGRFVLTDFIQIREAQNWRETLILKIFCRISSVPRRNLVVLDRYQRAFYEAGLIPYIEDISAAVLPGIAAWLEKFEEKWNGLLRPSLLLRYRLTASFLRYAWKSNLLGYIMVRAEVLPDRKTKESSIHIA